MRGHRLGVAIVGGGFAAASHLDALRRIAGARPLGVLTSTPQRTREAADRLGVERAYGALEDLLGDAEVDVVHTCTPNHLHHAITSAALDAGKHVLSEKPLAFDLDQAEDLAARAHAAGTVTGVCFTYRHFPLIQHLRATISEGLVGPIHLVHGAYLQDWLLLEDDWNWRLVSAQGGSARAVGDIGSHWIDLVQHVTGEKIIAACARLTRLYDERLRPGEVRTFERGDEGDARSRVAVDTEDAAAILLRLSGGAIGACTISQVSAGKKNELTIELDAAHTSYSWNQEDPNVLHVGRRDAPNERVLRDPSLVAPDAVPLVHYPGGHQEGWPDAMRNLVEDFYATIRGDRALQTVATFDEAAQVQRVVDAILRSDREGQWVDIRSEVTA
jgi:predicted dehydrogenase